MATKKKTVKKPKAKKTGSFLVLDGHIYIEDWKKGKRILQEEIDGKPVLQLIMQSLEHYLEVKGAL